MVESTDIDALHQSTVCQLHSWVPAVPQPAFTIRSAVEQS